MSELVEQPDTAQEKESPKYVKKPFTAEELVEINSGIELLKKLGVSKKYTNLLNAVPEWYTEDAEARKENRANLVNSFDGSDKLKDYLETDEFKDEHAGFNGIAKLLPVINNIVSYNARREKKTSATAKIQINIKGELYQVSKAYLESIMNLPREEKAELLLKHDKTTKCEVVDLEF